MNRWVVSLRPRGNSAFCHKAHVARRTGPQPRWHRPQITVIRRYPHHLPGGQIAYGRRAGRFEERIDVGLEP